MEESPEDKIVMHKLKCITIVSLIFMAAEILGGLLANSVAILADAFHLMSDVLAYVISLQAVHFSYKIPPKYMTFGYLKLQPLGALLNVTIIWFVTFELLMEATGRIIQKKYVTEPLYMLLTSIFGLGCNLYIMKILHSDQQHGGCSHSHGHDHNHNHSHSHNHHHQHSHQHSHSHNHPDKQKTDQTLSEQKLQANNNDFDISHNEVIHEHCYSPQTKSQELIQQRIQNCHKQHLHCSQVPCKSTTSNTYTELVSNEQLQDVSFSDDEEYSEPEKSMFSNLNLEAAYVHIISDIILSIGVIISALIIYIYADPTKWSYWHLADPFCTYLFSIVALYSTIDICKSSMVILLDGCDDKKLPNKIKKLTMGIKQVKKIEQVKVWSMNRQKNYCIIKVGVSQGQLDGVWECQKNIKSRIEKELSSYNIQAYIELVGQKQE